jgi:hypothetical protein
VRHELRATQRQLWEVTKGRPAEQPIIIGEEPTLESCEWDEDRFKAETRAYDKRVADAEKQKAAAAETAEKENHVWQQQLAAYQAKAAILPVKDFAQAQDTVTAALSVMMQSVIVKYAKEPAKVVYALGQHPAKLAALAQETDPFKLLIAVREMEDKLVVNKRKPPEPEAETIQSGSAALSTTADKQADKLLADAMKPGGNMNAYRKYMKGKKG